MIFESTKIVKDVYENSILKYMKKTAEQHFEENGINDNQWTSKYNEHYLRGFNS